MRLLFSAPHCFLYVGLVWSGDDHTRRLLKVWWSPRRLESQTSNMRTVVQIVLNRTHTSSKVKGKLTQNSKDYGCRKADAGSYA